tara:strand:+ start:1168 stop:1581 length:414 start_codon:yes stop_codon:yes gene_type:complete
MKKISWKFYTQRVGKTLTNILGQARTIEEAKKKLDKMNLSYPEDSLIQAALDKLSKREKNRLAREEAAKVPSAKKTTPRRSRKKSQGPKKEAKSPENKNASTDLDVKTGKLKDSPAEENTKNEKYFRRVVPTKKSRS